MDLLTITACALLIQPHCTAVPAASHPQVEAWQPEIARAASNFGVPQAWVKAVMAQESGGRATLLGRPIRSSAGAMGLMQLMPKTYNDLRKRLALGDNPDLPGDNIAAGTAYLRQMYVRYGYPNMFAAYNAGPGRFDDYLLRNRPLPDETLRYVSAIVPGAEAAFGRATATPVSNKAKPGRRSSGTTRDELFFPSAAGIGLVSGGDSTLFVALAAPHS
jgi:soluble lytic murein transglycosylase-like protein